MPGSGAIEWTSLLGSAVAGGATGTVGLGATVPAGAGVTAAGTTGWDVGCARPGAVVRSVAYGGGDVGAGVASTLGGI